MARAKTIHVCSECGWESPTWMGQCKECGKWDTMVEQAAAPVVRSDKPSRTPRGQWAGAGGATHAQGLGKIRKGERISRLSTGVNEFDRVLGGGLVPGSVVLIAGDPGIGKSTLLLQTMAHISAEQNVLYVTGEESLEQVADRATRLGLNPDRIQAIAESEIGQISTIAATEQPAVIVADSIQTLYADVLNSAPGTVSQVRECASTLTRYAKQTGCAVFLVGHVTKSGEVAGPRVLEHLVDTVLYFEGDTNSPFRLLRAYKNRFGSGNELGAFEMTGEGLLSVDNPSSMFLADDREVAPGSCVFVLQDGPRPLLIETQALLDTCMGSVPRRLCVGVDPNRVSMLLAVLHKHGSMGVSDLDVFVNAVGGVKIQETAVDLPLLLGMISSLKERAIPPDLACFGEIGLTGEVRPVQRAEDRLREAAKLGFKRAMVPARGLPRKTPQGIELFPVRNLIEAVETLDSFWH